MRSVLHQTHAVEFCDEMLFLSLAYYVWWCAFLLLLFFQCAYFISAAVKVCVCFICPAGKNFVCYFPR